MTPLMIAIVLATAVAALMFVVGSVTAERAEVRDSLRRLEGYQIQDVRDQEMLAPISERVVAPLLEGLTGVAASLHAGGLRRRGRAEAGDGGEPAQPQRRQGAGAQAARHRVGGALDPGRRRDAALHRLPRDRRRRRAVGRGRSCTPTC